MIPLHASNRMHGTRRERKFSANAEALEGRQLLTAGALDVTFGTGGYVLSSAPATKTVTPSDLANAVAIQSDGKILAAGDGVFNGVNSFEVTRLTAAGALDTSFGSGGRIFPLSGGSAKDMVVQSDGRIVVAGYVTVTSGSGKTAVTQSDVALVRLMPNGTLDPSFGQGGKVVTGISTTGTKFDSAYAVALQPDGKIVVGGDTYGSSATGMDSLLLRYNADGSLDTSFGGGGKVVTAWTNGDDNVADVVVQGDGKILVAGKGYLNENGSYPCYVARYNANGGLDDGSSNDLSPADRFGPAGIVTTPFSAKGAGELSWGDSLALQSDGSIIFARSGTNGTDYDLAVARFTADGVLDVANFGGGDGFVTLGLAGEQLGRSVAIQADDKIVLAGDFSGSGQIVARFDRNGSLDPTFGSGGYALNAFGSSSVTEDIALQADGKIVAVGAARVPSGRLTTNALLVARYLGDAAPLLATAVAPVAVRRALTVTQARPALAQALACWRARGEDTSRLGHIDLAVADLGGNRLGEASGSTITLDDDAAGWGWSVGRGRRPAGRMDLLAALEHEVGHLLGHDHAQGGVMAEVLAPGVRQLPADGVKVVPAAVAAPPPYRLVIEAFRGRGRHARAAARA